MFPNSRWEVDALRKDECLQLMELLGKAQPRRGVLVIELKAMIKDLLFSKEEEQEKPLLGFAKMNRSQLEVKARQLQIPVSENRTRRHLINIIREDVAQLATPKGSDDLGVGKHGAKTYLEALQGGSRMLPMDRPSGGSAIPLRTQEVLIVADGAQC